MTGPKIIPLNPHRKQEVDMACQAISQLVNTQKFQNSPHEYFTQLLRILQEYNITPKDLSPEERAQLLASFKVENVVDHIGTSSAIVTYLLSMTLIHHGQNLGGFTYNTVTGIGMLFSFGCALSFTSSALDLVRAYQLAHFRLKLIEYHQAEMVLMLRLWLVNLDLKDSAITVASILETIAAMAEEQVNALKRERDTLRLLRESPLVETDYDEYDHIGREISELDANILHASKTAKMIAGIDIDKPRVQELQNAMMNHGHRITDILHRPLYNINPNYHDRADTHIDERYVTLSSTSLYARRYEKLRQLAAYYPLIAMADSNETIPQFKNSQAIAAYFLNPKTRAKYHIHPGITAESDIFIGAYELYLDKATKLAKYKLYPDVHLNPVPGRVVQKKAEAYLTELRLRYMRILNELALLDGQIQHLEDELVYLESVRLNPDLGQKTITLQKNPAPAATVTANVPVPSLEENDAFLHYAIKAFDTRTKFMWKSEWHELKGFFTTLKKGLSKGIASLMTPDHEKFAFITEFEKYSSWHPRLWTYHLKCFIANRSEPIKKILTGLFVFAHIPYFAYYALKHFSHLLDNLQKVVDNLHKSVRDVDQALSYKTGDGPVVILTYPLRVVWALITFIPESLGGLAYWALTGLRSMLMNSEFNIAQTSRAINPGWIANWVEKRYISARKHKHSDQAWYDLKIIGLYFVTFLGGVYNTVATLISKLFPFYGANAEHIRASRDQLLIAMHMLSSQIEEGYHYLIEDPVVSSYKQSIDEQKKIEAKYPFFESPLSSSFWHMAVVLKFFASLIVNVLILGTYRLIKGIAKTAPLITATVVTCSTLMPGLSLPFFAFSFGASTQMNLAIASMCGDVTNGSHDMYNLATNLEQKYRLRIIEPLALSQLEDKTDLQAYQRWLTTFNHIENGRELVENLRGIHEKQENAEAYMRHHMDLFFAEYDKHISKCDDYPSLAKTFLSLQLAYFFIHGSDRDIAGRTPEQMKREYISLYDNFMSDPSIQIIADTILDSIPDPKRLSPGQCMNYVLGMTTLAGHDLTRRLMQQIREKYRDYYGKLNAKANNYTLHLIDNKPNEKSRIYKSTPDKNNPEILHFEKGIDARKLSFWESLKNRFIKPPLDLVIMEGYAVTGLDTAQRGRYYAAWMNPINQVNLKEGLQNLAYDLSHHTHKTCLLSRGTHKTPPRTPSGPSPAPTPAPTPVPTPPVTPKPPR